MATMVDDDWNPYTREAHRDPYPDYERLRRTSPVVRLHLDGRDVYALSRDSDIRSALRSPTQFSNEGGLSLHPRDRLTSGVIVAADPPEHDRLRRVLGPHMSVSAIAELAPRVRRYVLDMVRGVVDRKAFDVVTELARPIPTQIVSDLVGLPVEDRHRYPAWASAVTGVQGPVDLVPPDGFEQLFAMQEYITRLETDQQFAPGSLGARVFDARDQGIIDSDEAVSLVFGALVVAGLHSTVAGLSWLFRLIAHHPEWWEATVRWCQDKDPRRSGWADELVRYEVLFPHSYRTATATAEVGGYPIPAGARVLLLLGSANRDPERWPDPDEFDPTRHRGAQHLGFGGGVHRCLGEHLFRLEVVAVLDALVECGVTGIEVESGDFEHDASVRGWSSLSVLLHTKQET